VTIAELWASRTTWQTHHKITFYRNVHVYADRIIRMPLLTPPESHPIAGVSAKIEETGGVSSRSTLTRSAVPGMHGWQKQTDNRNGYVVIDGPDFQWQLEYLPQMDMGGARKFMTALNTAGRVAAIADAPVTTEVIPDSLDQLRKLAELRDAGIVTAEEFEAKKAKLQYSPDERHRAPQTTSAGWLGNGSRAALTARWPRRASRPGRCHFPRHPGEVSGVAGAGNHASCRALFRAVATR